MRLILETGFACRVTPPNQLGSYWLHTANGRTNLPQVKLYKSPRRAQAAAKARYTAEGSIVEVFPATFSVEIPDNAAPF
jgi:hypothetical protein